MLAAAATVPPPMDRVFASAAVPAPLAAPVCYSFSATSRDRPHRSASRIVGPSPACTIRSGASIAANNAAGLWAIFTSEVSCSVRLMRA